MKFDFDTKTILILILVFVLITTVGITGYKFKIDTMSFEKDSNGYTPPDEIPPDQIYWGAFTMKVILGDYFSGAAISNPTNDAFTLYHKRPGLGVSGTSITPGATGTTVELLKEDKGYVWMSFYHGDDYYMAEESFVNNNPRVSESEWVDFDNDGTDEFIAKIWAGDIGIPGQGLTPVVALSMPLIDEDDGTISDDNPANVTQGATVAATITWKLSGITAEDGYFLARLFFVTDETRVGDDIRLKSVSISGGWSWGGKSYYSAPILETSGNYECYYVNPVDYTDISNAVPVWRGTTAADTLYITLSLDCYLDASGDEVSITLYADWLTAEGTIDQDTDEVYVTYD